MIKLFTNNDVSELCNYSYALQVTNEHVTSHDLHEKWKKLLQMKHFN